MYSRLRQIQQIAQQFVMMMTFLGSPLSYLKLFEPHNFRHHNNQFLSIHVLS